MPKKSTLGVGEPSKKQREIIIFIERFKKGRGYSPSLQEIANNFDIAVPTAHQHVAALRGKGILTSEKGRQRSIRTINKKEFGVVEIPLMGIVAAGGPIEAIRDPKPVQVPRNMVLGASNYFAVRVAGNSMIGDGIFDGDVVIVRDQDYVDEGEKAIAYLPDKDAVTMKRLYKTKNGVKLVSSNPEVKPFYETNIEVQGKVVGVLRKEV
jgi:repressor LexA